MTELEKLINKFCPKGVHFEMISNVTTKISSGLNPRQNFKLNVDGASNFYVTVKEITTGKIIFSDKTDRITNEAVEIIQKRSKLEKDDVLLSGIGTIGKVAIVDIPTNNWNCSESVILLKPKKDIVVPKYLMYSLLTDSVQNNFKSNARGSTLKGIRHQDLCATKIPLPPIEVQKKIVEILDKFTKLEAELEAELVLRKKQYEYYRDKLLTFKERERVVMLGEILDYSRPDKFIVSSKTYDDNYETPVLTAGQTFILGFTNEKENIYKCSTTKPVIIFDDFTTATQWVDFDFKVKSSAMKILTPKKNVNLRFIYYIIKTLKYRPVQHGRQWISTYSKFSVPFPSIEKQNEIVSLLDKFYNLVSNLNSGLPAEIASRHKQYEYYLNKLHTFKELKE